MKTTLELPEDLFRQVKARAAIEGTTIKQIVLTALQNEMKHRQARVLVSYEVKLPLIRSKRPGKPKLNLTNADIEELLA